MRRNRCAPWRRRPSSWFWDYYADPADRTDPKVSPLRAKDLSNLPPAFVVTCQFDPLRDAYARAMASAGVPVRQITARGHTHTSLTMVDVVVSGEGTRAEMAIALRGFFKAAVSAWPRRQDCFGQVRRGGAVGGGGEPLALRDTVARGAGLKQVGRAAAAVLVRLTTTFVWGRHAMPAEPVSAPNAAAGAVLGYTSAMA